MPSLESQLKASVERRLKTLAREDPRLQWRKRWGSPYTTSGDPDLTGLWRGIHFEVELKRPGESPTPLQWHQLEAWKRAGALVFVIHDLAELDVAISTIRAAQV